MLEVLLCCRPGNPALGQETWDTADVYVTFASAFLYTRAKMQGALAMLLSAANTIHFNLDV